MERLRERKKRPSDEVSFKEPPQVRKPRVMSEEEAAIAIENRYRLHSRRVLASKNGELSKATPSLDMFATFASRVSSAAAARAAHERARGQVKKGPPEGMALDVYKAFNKIDKDHSGVIEAEEMVQCLKEFQRGVTNRQARRLIAECGPLLNENKGLVDSEGHCDAVDVFGFAKLKATIDVRLVREPWWNDSIRGKNKPLPYQREVRAIYTNPIVVWSVAAVIIGNFIVNILEKEYDPDPNEMKMKALWDGFDTAFNAIFLVELLANLYGYGFGPAFWRSGWNVFDTIITGVGVILLAGVSGPISQLKLLRAFRVFRLFKRIQSLNRIIMALLASIPGVANAFVILFIFYCIYAILAVELFRDFGINGTYMTDDLGSSRHIVSSITPRGYTNGIEYYGTYSRAMYTLFETMTGDSNFEALARPLTFGLYQRSAIFVSFFFVSFIILTGMVMTNVVVAVLLDKFSEPPSSIEMTDEQMTQLISYVNEEMNPNLDPNRAEPSPTTVPPTDYTKAQLFRLVERMDQRAMRTERAVERCMALIASDCVRLRLIASDCR
jgi:hypothetical protein